MGQTNRCTSAWPALAVVLAVSFSALQPAVVADSLASEREQLAALARQLDLIDRLAEHAAIPRRRNAPATTSTTPGCVPT
jgi:RAQPRD family integrative conjugative element protein